MRSIEVSGKTVEEAKELAAQELGVPIEEIEFEIIEEPSKGFLGLAHNPAKVKATTASDAVEPKQAQEPAAEEEKTMQTGETSQVADEMVALLDQIITAMNASAKAHVKHVEDDEIAIDIEGQDVAMLIGKGGQTLDALQYLIGIAANRKFGQKLRVVVDAEGYRQRHADMLTARALDYARHVKETGEEAVFDPMPARDRRIIHMALADDPSIFTYSEGEGADRHLVISPKKEEAE
jgi:spoIIIJ-associated protein